jgi:hypothetical protein
MRWWSRLAQASDSQSAGDKENEKAVETLVKDLEHGRMPPAGVNRILDRKEHGNPPLPRTMPQLRDEYVKWLQRAVLPVIPSPAKQQVLNDAKNKPMTPQAYDAAQAEQSVAKQIAQKEMANMGNPLPPRDKNKVAPKAKPVPLDKAPRSQKQKRMDRLTHPPKGLAAWLGANCRFASMPRTAN